MSLPYIGVMTGNSMDAADAVLADFSGGGCRLLAAAREPIAAQLSDAMRQFADGGAIDAPAFLAARNELTETCARAVANLGVAAKQVAAVGCHGQTVAHHPALSATWQMLNGALLAERVGIDVVCDFRSRDVAAGGEGAPLAPPFHHYLFAASAPCDVVNIGGIANISRVRADGADGHDLGPGVMLLDAWHKLQRGGAFDEDGQFAATGKPHDEFLRELLRHPFFPRPPPKSCGREEFSLPRLSLAPPQVPPQDIQATFAELTARLIADAVSAPLVYVCGGGARNKDLMQRLARMTNAEIHPTDDAGIPAEQMEAALCAWLAERHVRRLPLALDRFGKLARIPGALYPR